MSESKEKVSFWNKIMPYIKVYGRLVLLILSFGFLFGKLIQSIINAIFDIGMSILIGILESIGGLLEKLFEVSPAPVSTQGSIITLNVGIGHGFYLHISQAGAVFAIVLILLFALLTMLTAKLCKNKVAYYSILKDFSNVSLQLVVCAVVTSLIFSLSVVGGLVLLSLILVVLSIFAYRIHAKYVCEKCSPYTFALTWSLAMTIALGISGLDVALFIAGL